jgi:hypothetical protein
MDYIRAKHGDMIKIYNLCAEPGYAYSSEDVDKIPVTRFPFRDHNACSLSRISMFCMDAALFL